MGSDVKGSFLLPKSTLAAAVAVLKGSPSVKMYDLSRGWATPEGLWVTDGVVVFCLPVEGVLLEDFGPPMFLGLDILTRALKGLPRVSKRRPAVRARFIRGADGLVTVLGTHLDGPHFREVLSPGSQTRGDFPPLSKFRQHPARKGKRVAMVSYAPRYLRLLADLGDAAGAESVRLTIPLAGGKDLHGVEVFNGMLEGPAAVSMCGVLAGSIMPYSTVPAVEVGQTLPPFRNPRTGEVDE
jgi:hypothetical protein